MGTVPLNYWFDSQLRRYAMQFCRVFQNFTYQTGREIGGEPEYRPIPVKHGMSNRQVASILIKNSENIMQSVPMISCYISDIDINRNRTQAPYYVERKQIHERGFDEASQMYTDQLGASYQLNRIIPVPLDLTLKADIWTSNLLQKDQIFEQIIILFNPSIDLQHSNNPYDWAGLTILELTNTSWSSRGMPIGSNEDLEMMTFTFKAEVWMQPPSWLHPQKLIQQIITNIGEAEQLTYAGMGEGYDIDYSVSDLMARIITTPGNHQIRVVEDEITLLGPNGSEVDDNGEIYSWASLIELYGKFRDNISQLRLKTSDNLDDETNDIIGTFRVHPTKPNKLIWYLDAMTIPQNSLDAITGVLDPHLRYPGKGLPIAEGSHRYLLTSDIGIGVVRVENTQTQELRLILESKLDIYLRMTDDQGNLLWMKSSDQTDINNTLAWGDLQANANDIIQYNAVLHKWQMVFDSENSPGTEHVRNSHNNKQLRWDGSSWSINIEGEYNPGYWRLFL